MLRTDDDTQLVLAEAREITMTGYFWNGMTVSDSDIVHIVENEGMKSM